MYTLTFEPMNRRVVSSLIVAGLMSKFLVFRGFFTVDGIVTAYIVV
jgi:hypothetical protein